MADQRQRGSALVLAPALALLVLTLGTLAVDRTAVLLAQRRLVVAAQAAAADAVAAGVDQDELRTTGQLRYDATAIDRSIRRSLIGDEQVQMGWSITDGVLEIRLRRSAPIVFGLALGGSRGERISARASAVLALSGP